MIEKILIYGSNGWIGSQFKKFLQENTKYIIIDGLVRLDNMEELEKEIKEVLPSHIIGFTGRTHGKIGDEVYSTIDYLEEGQYEM